MEEINETWGRNRDTGKRRTDGKTAKISLRTLQDEIQHHAGEEKAHGEGTAREGQTVHPGERQHQETQRRKYTRNRHDGKRKEQLR